jgi:Gram-negative bacterial TonB protein C-terminal
MTTFLKTSPVILIALFFFFTNAKAQTKAGVQDTTHTTNVGPYSKVEVEASFPGGAAAWTAYITKQVMQNADGFRKKDFGTCIVKFIVDKHGDISEVEATTMKKTRLAKVAVEAIENGPKWTPAQQNGRYVNAYRLQPVTVSEPGK